MLHHVTKVFIESKLLCNGEKSQDKKLKLKSSSNSTQNSKVVHLKTSVNVTYDI
jgi:hypothetical protein